MLEVEKILKEKGIDYRLIELSDKAISFEDVVKFSKGNIRKEEICKTIVVKDKKGDKYAFFLKGDQKVDFAKAKEIVGSKVSIISYEDLKKATGTEPGAVTPLLLDMNIFVDRKVFDTEKINFGSGDHLFGIEIASKDLRKAINFEIVDVAQN